MSPLVDQGEVHTAVLQQQLDRVDQAALHRYCQGRIAQVAVAVDVHLRVLQEPGHDVVGRH